MGCSDWLYRFVNLWGIFVGGLYLYGAVCCVFVQVVVCFVCLLFGGMPCPAVMFCSCGLLFVVCVCNVSLAVLLFGCMFVLCWL